ncbi:MAG: starch-binding protein [Prevotella sp.]|nr:starch-binding protein [Prevotella sp.]
MAVTFSSTYTYNGGNLLVGIYSTNKGSYSTVTFYGVNQDAVTALTSYGKASVSSRYFIPKTTITYEQKVDGPSLAVYDGSSKLTTGYSYNFGLATAGTTKTFTLKNPGTESITVDIAATNGFGVSPTSVTIEAKDEVTLTVTMPDDTADGTVTMTPTVEGVDAFTINVSGTIRDESKMFEDFAGKALPEGWTTAGIGSYTTGSYASSYVWSFANGYAQYRTSNSANYIDNYKHSLVTPELIIATGGETMFFKMQKDVQYASYVSYLLVQYSADGSEWNDVAEGAFEDEAFTGDWQNASVTIPETAKYVRFVACGVDIDDIYGGTIYVPEGANFAIDKSSGSFGVAAIGDVAEQLFTITNSGNADLPVAFTDATDFYVAKTVMFTKPDGWNGVNLYVWDSSNNTLNGAWPGNAMTYSYNNEYGQAVYVASLPKDAAYIIFNDGSNQTSDIPTTGFKHTIAYYLDNTTPTQWKNEDFSIPANGTANFYVRMNTATAGAKSGNIELAFDALNATSFTLPVSGVVMPADATVVDFNDGKLPDNWESTGTWTFDNGEAGAGSAATMTTTALEMTDDDFIVLKVRNRNSSWTDDYVQVEAYNGTDWTVVKKIYSSEFVSSTDYTSLVVTGFPATTTKLRFTVYYAYIDEIVGMKFSANDPRLAVLQNDTEVVTGTACDLGWGTSDASATYYIKNKGTGTLTISDIACTATGVTATTADNAMTVAADADPLALTITMSGEGAHVGTITITTDGGNFEIPVNGVVRNTGKMYLDFSAEGAAFPVGWSTGSWSISGNTAVAAGTLQTTTLKAAAGEQMVIEAISTGGYYSTASLSYSYSTDNGENWTEATSVASQLNTNTYSIITLDAVDAENAADVLVRLTGSNVSVRRIYGFEAVAVAVMETTAANIAFGMQTAESAEQTFTISNTGEATLTGLSVTLGKTDDAAEYAIRMTDSEDAEFTGTELAVGQTITVHVKQLFNAENLGSKSDVLTIAADGQTTVTINLTGTTRDGSLLYVDFDEPNAFPEGWQAGANWSMYTFGTDRYAYQSSSNTPSALVTTPLTVEEGQTLSFKVARNSSGYGYTTSLKTRYSQDGGANWSEYAAQYGTDSSNEAGSAYTTIELSELPAGNLIFEFYGNNIKLDMIQGVKTTTAPALALTEGGAAVENGSTKDFGNLSTDGVATYTVKNTGNAVLKSTITGEGVTVSPASVELAAGETAEITVTMAFGEPYGAKTGSMKIESEDWVGDMTVNYTAEAVDPTDFVIDFEDNAKPAGWYSESWTYNTGAARVYTGTAKPMITELVGAEEGKNVLSFDAKAYNGDNQTLNVYTSADRKTWSEAQAFTLTAESQTFSLGALADGSYYVKFEASNAIVDNIKGVKKLDAPEHDLYYVSATWPTGDVTPGKSYSVSVNVASLRAEETVTAQLFFGETVLAEQTEQVIANGATKTFTLTGTAPAAGTYDVYAKVFNADGTVETEHQSVTVEDTRYLNITAFTRTSEASVVADENNEFTATFNVTVQNTGTASLAADEVSVSLTDATNAYQTVTWTTESSDVLYMNTSNGTDDIAAADAQLAVWMWGKSEGEWASFTKINDGFYSVALNGNTNFIVVRTAPDKELSLDDCWNKTGDMSLTGNLIKFTSYNGSAMNFNTESMGYLEPTMSTTLKVSVKLSAGEGGAFTFYAKENVSDTQYFLSQSVNVTKNVATGVSRLLTDDELEGLDIYNLQGQRVEKTAKGLLIINGKKVVRK